MSLMNSRLNNFGTQDFGWTGEDVRKKRRGASKRKLLSATVSSSNDTHACTSLEWWIGWKRAWLLISCVILSRFVAFFRLECILLRLFCVWHGSYFGHRTRFFHTIEFLDRRMPRNRKMQAIVVATKVNIIVFATLARDSISISE